MRTLRVQITRFINDQQPGWVECQLVDVQGFSHFFIEKIPMVSVEDLWRDSIYPSQGFIECFIEEEWLDEHGRYIASVNTQKPWGIASTTGQERFLVLSSQVQSHTPGMPRAS